MVYLFFPKRKGKRGAGTPAHFGKHRNDAPKRYAWTLPKESYYGREIILRFLFLTTLANCPDFALNSYFDYFLYLITNSPNIGDSVATGLENDLLYKYQTESKVKCNHSFALLSLHKLQKGQTDNIRHSALSEIYVLFDPSIYMDTWKRFVNQNLKKFFQNGKWNLRFHKFP